MGIPIIASLLIAAMIVLALYVGSHRLSGGTTAVMLGLASLGAVLVVFPGITSSVATMLGVGRGTDLLLYLAIVAGLFVCANLYFQIKRHEARIAELSRAIALRQPIDSPMFTQFSAVSSSSIIPRPEVKKSM